MQISLEEIEDILIMGESEAIKNECQMVIDLILKNPDSIIDEPEEETSARTGFRLSFRPEPCEQPRRGSVSTDILEESDISVSYRVMKKDGSILRDWYIQTTLLDVMDEHNPPFNKLEFSHINFDGKTYTDKNKFLEAFGINNLATVSFKLPATVFAKFKKICAKKYGTVTGRLRTLVEGDIENEIKLAVRKEVFK